MVTEFGSSPILIKTNTERIFGITHTINVSLSLILCSDSRPKARILVYVYLHMALELQVDLPGRTQQDEIYEPTCLLN